MVTNICSDDQKKEDKDEESNDKAADEEVTNTQGYFYICPYIMWHHICVTYVAFLFFCPKIKIGKERETKTETRGDEKTLLPAVGEESETAGSCDSLDTTDTRKYSIYDIKTFNFKVVLLEEA